MDIQRSKMVDVRTIPPPQRHLMIFEIFDALTIGDSFELVNDHEPRPLYYTFLHERNGSFHWEDLESGPTVWRVKISKETGKNVPESL
ncbi:MAG: DUF2249 domain-containing protein [Bacteroidota bacterium]